MNTYTFAVTKVYPDNRVLVFLYVRVGQLIHVVMTLYSDATLSHSQTLLDVQMVNPREGE